MRTVPRTLRTALVVALPVVLAVTALGLPSASRATGLPGAGVGFSVAANGTISASLTSVLANGSALRFAMDGDFNPLIDALPLTAAQRSTLLATLTATESNPIFAGLFGDHDGKVDYPVDVARFQALLSAEASLFPAGAFTGIVNLTLDGQVPVSEAFGAVTFLGAAGPNNSSAPIAIQGTLTASFSSGGAGVPHTFRLGRNLPALLSNLSPPTSSANFSLTTSAAQSIGSVAGLTQVTIMNDPFGWGPASVSGQYVPAPGHNVTIQFGPAFPTGYALIVGGAAVALGISVGLLGRRRRRRRAMPQPPPTGSPAPSEGLRP